MAVLIPRSAGPTEQVSRAPDVRNTTFVDNSQNIRNAQALQGVANNYLQQKQEENDLTAVMQARRELSDWEAAAFDPANPEGISKYQGKNALGANEALVPSLDARVGEIGARLTPRQRQKFDMVAGNFRDQLQTRINGHMDREHTAYIDAEQKATVENLGQDAVSAGLSGDMERQEAVTQEVLAIQRARYESKGMGEELIKASERGTVSTIRAQTIEGMMNTDPFQAQAYFDRYADQMVPEDIAKVQRVLEPVMVDAEAGPQADVIIAGGSTNGAATPEAGAQVDAMIVGIESGGNDNAKNPGSSATGAGQFLDSTWLGVVKRNRPDVAKGKSDAQILAMRTDGKLSREMVSAFRAENAQGLAARGVPQTAVNLYAAHHFGVGGATKFATLGDSAPMTSVLSAREIRANPYLRGKTIGDVKANWAKRGLSGDGGVAQSAGTPRSEADAIAYARDTIRDPRRQNAVVREIREKFQLQDMRTRAQEKAMTEHAYTAISQWDPKQNAALPLRQMIGADSFAYFERKGQLDSLEKMRRDRLTGTLVQDDPILVDAFHREAVLSPNTFMARDLNDPKVITRLSTDTLTSLKKMQADGKKPEQRAEWATQAERIESGLRVLQLDSSRLATGSGSDKKNQPLKEKQAAYGIVYREAERALVQSLGGKKPTPEQLDVLMRDVTRRVADNPWLLEKDKEGNFRASSLEGYGTAMPDSVRQEAIDSYRAKYNGATPTEAQIVQYGVKKARGG